MNEFSIIFSPGQPARSDSSRAAALLGVKEHDIPALVNAKLLKPLGGGPNAPKNMVKYFATVDLLRAANDVQWLDKATRVIVQYWKRKNANRFSSRFNPANGVSDD